MLSTNHKGEYPTFGRYRQAQGQIIPQIYTVLGFLRSITSTPKSAFMSAQEVTYKKQSHSPSQNPMETYAVRRRFNIETNEPNRITENLGSVTLYTEIIEQLCVGRQRRSQVLIIRQRNTETQSLQMLNTPLSPNTMTPESIRVLTRENDLKASKNIVHLDKVPSLKRTKHCINSRVCTYQYSATNFKVS